jgi:hypothetical protein
MMNDYYYGFPLKLNWIQHYDVLIPILSAEVSKPFGKVWSSKGENACPEK